MRKLKYLGAVSLLFCATLALYQNASNDANSSGASSDSPSADVQAFLFSNGAEFPGATGSLHRVAPTSGDSIIVLNYDFTNGGNYVAARMSLAAPVEGDTVRFKINAPLQSLLYVRVIDESKQTLQFQVNHVKSISDDTGWATIEVPVTSSTSYWGGAKDGQLHGKIVNLSIGIGNTKRNPENIIGKGYFRQIQVLKKSKLTPLTPSAQLSSIKFNNGAEFPGATGSLEVLPPKGGDSIQALSYDFSKGGNYVSTRMKLATPIDASYVRFAFIAPPEVQIGVRVKDETGQTLQKIIPRNSLIIDEAGWATVTVHMLSSDSHWGGANSGTLQGHIQSVDLLVDHGPNKGVEGVAYFRQVELLNHNPSLYYSAVAPLTAAFSAVKFSNGSEFPGASGSLQLIPDGKDVVHKINYDLSKGNYVADVMYLANPVPATEVRFLAKIPKGVEIALRLTDSAGQVFQTYFIDRPLETIADNGWRLYIVPLNTWDFHYSGSNDGTFRGAVTRVAVLMDVTVTGRNNSVITVQPTGTFYIKNLSLGVSSPSHIDLKPETPVYPSLGKANSNPALKTGVSFHARTEASYAAAEEIGFKFMRSDASWGGMEKQKGVYTTTGLSQAVDAMNSHGITPVLIMDYSNKLYPPPADYPIDMAAFQKYAATLTTALRGKNVIFEIWNEEDLWGFTAEQYAILLKTTADTIHAVDPKRSVISGGLAGTKLPYLYKMLKTAIPKGISAFAIHPYSAHNAERMANLRAAIIDMLASFGLHAPLTSTEVGNSSYWYDQVNPLSPEAQNYQATMMVRQILTGWASGEAMTFIYQLQDSRFDPNSKSKPQEFYFGIVGPSFEEKPAKKAVQMLLKSTQIRSYQGVVTGSSVDVQAMKFTSPQKETLFIVWSDMYKSSVSFTAVENCDKSIDIYGAKSAQKSSCVIDHQGQPVSCIKNSNGTVTCPISEAAGPVFVRMKR